MISSGIKYLDNITGGLKLGDNVVWQISNGVPVEYFIKSLLNNDTTNSNIVYINFNYSPHTICKRFDDSFKNLNVILIDAFTNGKGNSDPVFLDFYYQKADYNLSKVICVENPRDITSFMKIMNEIQLENKSGSFYIFDSLTGIYELWKDERAVLDFFSFTCPKLYDLNTIAYWIFEKDAHSKEFIAGLTHITQIVIAINNTDSGFYELRIVKLEDRPVLANSGAHQFRIINRDIQFQDLNGDFLKIGNRLKDLRKSLNITQTELALKLGMTPGAVSQIENDLITPSLNTLVNISTIFNKPVEFFICTDSNRENKVYEIFRKKELKQSSSKNITISTFYEDKKMDIKLFLIKIGGYESVDGTIMMHKGKEFISVINGTLNLLIEGDDVNLSKGDSILLEKCFVSKWGTYSKSECEFLYMLF
jgi:transcriptional regulator with XRE-family HTH domain